MVFDEQSETAKDFNRDEIIVMKPESSPLPPIIDNEDEINDDNEQIVMDEIIDSVTTDIEVMSDDTAVDVTS